MAKKLIGSAALTPSSDTGFDLTTKGDTHGYSDQNARIPISTNNFSLLCDSAESLGLKWAASPTSVLSGAQDILYSSAANTLARLAAGTDGDILTTHGTGSAPTWETSSGGATLTRHSENVSTATSTTSLSYVDVPDMDATLTGSGAGNCISFYSVTVESSNDFEFTCEWSTDGEIPPSPTYDGTGGKGLGLNISSISLTLGSQTSKWMQRLAGAGTLTVCRNNAESESQWLEIS